MKVRLGFAVAAHLEPEILVVDEVLAVGDAEFQKKAVGKMQDVSSKDGRTILFVSHNMAAVKSLCTKGIVLTNGKISFTGNTHEAVENYISGALKDLSTEKNWDMENAPGNENIKLLKVEVKPEKGNVINTVSGINISYEFYNKKKKINLGSTLELVTKDNVIVLHRGVLISDQRNSKEGIYKISWHIPGKLLNSNRYFMNLYFGENQKYPLFIQENALNFEILNVNYDDETSNRVIPGIIKPELDYKIEYQRIEK
jgi:lipopolysaccharide transport system ATP-binding protein